MSQVFKVVTTIIEFINFFVYYILKKLLNQEKQNIVQTLKALLLLKMTETIVAQKQSIFYLFSFQKHF